MRCRKCNRDIAYRDVVPPGWHMFAPELFEAIKRGGQLCKRCAEARDAVAAPARGEGKP